MKQHGQRGFALPVAVFALVVIGVLVTSGFYTVRQESRIGVADENAGMAFYLTEQGLVDLISSWNAGLFGALPDWGDTVVTRDYPGMGRVTKMTDLLYFVDADGLVTKGGPSAPAPRTEWVSPCACPRPTSRLPQRSPRVARPPSKERPRCMARTKCPRAGAVSARLLL